MSYLRVFALALALPLLFAAPAALAAGRDQGPSAPAAQKVAGGLCKAEAHSLGQAGFEAKYGAGDAGQAACVQAQTAAAQALLQGCAAQGKPGSDAFKACVQAQLKPSGQGGEGDKQTEAIQKVAGGLCKAEAHSLGKDAFQTKYGAGDAGQAACVQVQTAAAQALLQGCAAQGKPGSDAFKACVQAQLKPSGGGGGGDKQAEAAQKVAEALCKGEVSSLGKDAFQTKYGTGKDGLVACVQAQTAAAQALLQGCAAQGKPGSDAFKACVQAQLKPSGGGGGGSSGGGGGAASAQGVQGVAQALCKGQVKSSGKDAFQAKYGAGQGGFTACVQAQQSAAQALLQSAASDCKSQGQPGSDAFKSCVKGKIQVAVGG